jgi:hypothetical protein
MTTAQRPARALVDRKRRESTSLPGGPSGLVGIATFGRNEHHAETHIVLTRQGGGLPRIADLASFLRFYVPADLRKHE